MEDTKFRVVTNQIRHSESASKMNPKKLFPIGNMKIKNILSTLSWCLPLFFHKWLQLCRPFGVLKKRKEYIFSFKVDKKLFEKSEINVRWRTSDFKCSIDWFKINSFEIKLSWMQWIDQIPINEYPASISVKILSTLKIPNANIVAQLIYNGIDVMIRIK